MAQKYEFLDREISCTEFLVRRRPGAYMNMFKKPTTVKINAHHKNGVAESSILTVSECARSLILQLITRWKSGIHSTIFALAVHYAAYLYNHIPFTSNVFPDDVFHGTIFPHHKLRTLNV